MNEPPSPLSSENETTPPQKKTLRRILWVASGILLLIVGVAFFMQSEIRGRIGSRYTCMNNIRNVGIAMINYTSQNNGMLPLAVQSDESGQPLHSWRTALLPILDQAALFRSIRHDLPWNAEENQQARETIIPVMTCPAEKEWETNQTNYFTITGEETPFPKGGGVTLDQISQADGQTTTLMIVEATGQKIQWMEPRDLEYSKLVDKDGKLSAEGPFSKHNNTFNAMFLDGHARTLNNNIDPVVLKSLATWNGKEDVSLEDF